MKAPKHLQPETRQWFAGIVAEHDLTSSELRTLQAALEAWDRAQEALERIAKDGAYLPNRFGELRPHPALSVERDARIGFLRAMRELALDGIEDDGVRPPRVAGRYAS